MTASDVIHLINPTGKEKVDNIIRDFIMRCESSFPGRILGYYLMGSQLDNTENANSDIDLTVVFADGPTRKDKERFSQLQDSVNLLNSVEIGCYVQDKKHFDAGIPLYIKAASLLYGDHVFKDIPLLSIDTTARRWITGSFYLMQRLHGVETGLKYPLNYPDNGSDFYGYHFAEKDGVITTKLMVSTVARMAGAILALKTERHAKSKRDSILLYKSHIGGLWADYVESVYLRMNQSWHYNIPHLPEEHAEFQDLCRQFLGFENYFLKLCRPTIMKDLHHQDVHRRNWAENCLARIML